MNPRLPATRQVSVDVVTVAFDSLSGLPCPACESGLELSQPDPHRPDLFLGICPGCRALHLIEASPGHGPARVAALAPIVKAIHRPVALKRRVGG